MARSICALRLQ